MDAPSSASRRVLFEDDAVVVDEVEFALQGKVIVSVAEACSFLEAQEPFQGMKVQLSHSF